MDYQLFPLLALSTDGTGASPDMDSEARAYFNSFKGKWNIWFKVFELYSRGLVTGAVQGTKKIQFRFGSFWIYFWNS